MKVEQRLLQLAALAKSAKEKEAIEKLLSRYERMQEELRQEFCDPT